MKLLCKLFGHKRVYWNRSMVDDKKGMGGVFSPYYCSRCGHEEELIIKPNIITPKDIRASISSKTANGDTHKPYAFVDEVAFVPINQKCQFNCDCFYAGTYNPNTCFKHPDI